MRESSVRYIFKTITSWFGLNYSSCSTIKRVIAETRSMIVAKWCQRSIQPLRKFKLEIICNICLFKCRMFWWCRNKTCFTVIIIYFSGPLKEAANVLMILITVNDVYCHWALDSSLDTSTDTRVCEWVIVVLCQNEQFFSYIYIIERTSYILIRWWRCCPLCTRLTRWVRNKLFMITVNVACFGGVVIRHVSL
jgi:hypothetical protein